MYKNCQSCGMPFSRDKQGGGTEAEGSKSKLYCSHCYRQGRFTSPDLTVEEMKERVRAKIAEFGIPRFIAGFMVRNMQKLERWKSPQRK